MGFFLTSAGICNGYQLFGHILSLNFTVSISESNLNECSKENYTNLSRGISLFLSRNPQQRTERLVVVVVEGGKGTHKKLPDRRTWQRLISISWVLLTRPSFSKPPQNCAQLFPSKLDLYVISDQHLPVDERRNMSIYYKILVLKAFEQPIIFRALLTLSNNCGIAQRETECGGQYHTDSTCDPFAVR